jgi:hypothetical protein
VAECDRSRQLLQVKVVDDSQRLVGEHAYAIEEADDQFTDTSVAVSQGVVCGLLQSRQRSGVQRFWYYQFPLGERGEREMTPLLVRVPMDEFWTKSDATSGIEEMMTTCNASMSLAGEKVVLFWMQRVITGPEGSDEKLKVYVLRCYRVQKGTETLDFLAEYQKRTQRKHWTLAADGRIIESLGTMEHPLSTAIGHSFPPQVLVAADGKSAVYIKGQSLVKIALK